jgi:hypothetical protein
MFLGYLECSWDILHICSWVIYICSRDTLYVVPGSYILVPGLSWVLLGYITHMFLGYIYMFQGYTICCTRIIYISPRAIMSAPGIYHTYVPGLYTYVPWLHYILYQDYICVFLGYIAPVRLWALCKYHLVSISPPSLFLSLMSPYATMKAEKIIGSQHIWMK